MEAPLPPNEGERLTELQAYEILDTLPEQAYDDIAFLAAHICSAPIAVISLVDSDRQWFKAKRGLDVDETSRDVAFCAHAVLEPGELLVVEDATSDDRFADNPLVISDPSIRFYAGAPLVTPSGNALGTLCVIDREARQIDPDQAEALQALSRQVMRQLELRVSLIELEQRAATQQGYERQLEEYQRQLEQNLATIHEQSVTDALTGCRNRWAFMERLEEELARSRRSGAELSLLIVDLDGFKAYNDEFGHVAGDDALKALGELLRDEGREADLVARYGGDEFAVIMADTQVEGAQVMAERFRKAIEQGPWPNRPVTISGGIAMATPATQSAQDFVITADRALYAAKDAGRNCIVLAT